MICTHTKQLLSLHNEGKRLGYTIVAFCSR
jgi:hypothetical protein